MQEASIALCEHTDIDAPEMRDSRRSEDAGSPDRGQHLRRCQQRAAPEKVSGIAYAGSRELGARG